MKVLMTGFEPFGSEKRNPSWEAVKLLPGTMDHVVIVRVELPVVYDDCAERLIQTIEKEQPDAVLCVGQAGGRSGITPEFIAVNVKDSKAADNAGNCFFGERIAEDGPAGYESTLPVRRMVKAMQEAGIPAYLSYTAGTYVCNNLMYKLLHYAAEKCPGMRCGFIHIPFDEIQAVEHGGTVASLPLETAVNGLKACIRALKEDFCESLAKDQ